MTTQYENENMKQREDRRNISYDRKVFIHIHPHLYKYCICIAYWDCVLDSFDDSDIVGLDGLTHGARSDVSCQCN